MTHLSYMAAPRTPKPAELARTTRQHPTPVSFRLSTEDHNALVSLAERAHVGHSTLARRIVEHYIREHAPRNRRRS